MGRLALGALAFLGIQLLCAGAQAERRVALVIGNARYEAAGALTNPVNDATDIAAKLRSIGFEVIEGHDLGKREIERMVGDFSDRLDGADAGLFFYAGHGLQVDGRNFIMPVDAKVDVPAKLRLEAVQIDDVLDIMEQQTKVSLVFLDACRNNPFVAVRGSASNRSAQPLGGLAQFDSSRGSFIAFSTAPGAVAMDGSGRNSPFAAAIVRHIGEPGLSVSDLMIEVRKDVVAETRDKQRPWEQGSLTDRFEFVPAGGVAASEPAPAVTAPSQEIASLERSVGDASIETFLRDRYLAPAPGTLAADIRSVYASPASIFGTPLSGDALVKAKADWFAQWSSWKLSLVPGSLAVKLRGSDNADVVFAMDYDYAPRDAAAAHVVGKARVYLGLVKSGSNWLVSYETSEVIP